MQVKKGKINAGLSIGLKRLEYKIDHLCKWGDKLQYTIEVNKELTDFENYISQYKEKAWEIKAVLDMLYHYSFISKAYYDTCNHKITSYYPKEVL